MLVTLQVAEFHHLKFRYFEAGSHDIIQASLELKILLLFLLKYFDDR